MSNGAETAGSGPETSASGSSGGTPPPPEHLSRSTAINWQNPISVGIAVATLLIVLVSGALTATAILVSGWVSTLHADLAEIRGEVMDPDKDRQKAKNPSPNKAGLRPVPTSSPGKKPSRMPRPGRVRKK